MEQMKWITCEEGVLRFCRRPADMPGDAAPADAALPGAAAPLDLPPLPQGTINEFLYDPARGELPPAGPVLWMLTRSQLAERRADSAEIVWFDSERSLSPLAIAAAGIPLGKLHIVRPRQTDLAWAAVQCLRCKGVGALVASIGGRLSRVDVRRIQLAAEQGGGIGLLLRSVGSHADVYAAASRWRISPAPGSPEVQRWKMELLHGQGWNVGRSFLLELRRAAISQSTIVPMPLHSPAPLVDRPAPAPRRRAAG